MAIVGYHSRMNILKSLLALTTALAAVTLVSCGTATVQPGDASEAVYETPDRIENQERVQELHGDILRNEF